VRAAEILTARTDAAAEVAEVAAAEAAASESAAAVEAATAAKAAADPLGARKALAPELPKESGGGAEGKAEDAEEIPGRPMFIVGAREELKTRGGSLSRREQKRQSRPRDQHRSSFYDHSSALMR
jgi:hypothetical protein